MKTNYLIIGQGIAGSVLAMMLHFRGKKVVVMNKEGKSWSSSVAAGVYNPMNFRKMSPTWRAAITSPLAKQFYAEAEKITGGIFHRDRDIVRIFTSEEERKTWENYCASDQGLFAGSHVRENYLSGLINAPFGAGIVKGGGVVDTAALMYCVKEFFSHRNEYRDEWFDHDKLEIFGDHVLYDKRIAADKIIFAEGHLAVMNKYFSNIPLVPTKGEIIHVSIPGLQTEDVLNGPVYLAPLGNDLFVCGATFNPGKADENNTAEAREELLKKLSSMIAVPFRAESQFAGVRPAGRDKKPLIGKHREYDNVYLFNGSGSKGVLQSPLLAQMLIELMEEGKELPRDVDVNRFKKIHN